MVTQPDFKKATTFVWSSARLIDRSVCAPVPGRRRGACGRRCLPTRILTAASETRSSPTSARSVSQPQPVEVALHVLDELDAMADPAVARACDYLSTITTNEGGVPFVLPMPEDFPRAPWWNAEPDPPAAINPTAAIVGLLHKHGIRHSWLGPATEFCWRKIEGESELGGYDFLTVFTFLRYVPDRSRAESDFDLVARASSTAGHARRACRGMSSCRCSSRRRPTRPSDCSTRRPSGGAGCAGGVPAADGWPISWEPPSQAAALEWRGFVTVGALETLRAYGRLARAEARTRRRDSDSRLTVTDWPTR
jgi:hypothetical protein